MAKTWRRSPIGAPKEPRPPEKGGKHNILSELDEFTEYDDDDDNILNYDDDDNEDLL